MLLQAIFLVKCGIIYFISLYYIELFIFHNIIKKYDISNFWHGS